jgi:flagellin
MTQLTAEINRIGNTTEFNNQKVLNGGSTTASQTLTLSLQIGANKGQTFDVKVSDMRSQALGISSQSNGAVSSAITAGSVYFAAAGGTITGGGTDTLGAANEVSLDVSTKAYAGKSIAAVDKAINTVSTERAKLGAFQNRLEHTIANLNTSSENLTAAESRIRDVDMAKEMMNFTKQNILNQAAQAMLAQANQAPQGVLQLLR